MWWNRNRSQNTPKIALILSGGGARAAYQVGVLQAIADLVPKDTPNLFPIVCGTSAGAINAAAIAIFAQHFREAIWRLVHVWANFHVTQVFRADSLGLTKSGLHWLAAILAGGLGKRNPVSLLDRTPLFQLLGPRLPFENIQKNIDADLLHALSITASSYQTGHSVAFYQGVEDIAPWHKSNNVGVPTSIKLNHLMGSSSIPFLFEAVQIGQQFYGDGSMRQTNPLSPAMRLGADKTFVIGVKAESDAEDTKEQPAAYPTLGQIGGQVLDSIFLDNMDLDLELMQGINHTLKQIPERHIPEDSRIVRKVESMSISPSQDIFRIAAKHTHLLPKQVRFILKGVGASGGRGANLISYLLFEKAFCRELITLGYSDSMNRKEEIIDFLEINNE